MVVTRFAPSPTGRLHLGNLRTALFNALFARSAGGRFLLRIEDTDAARDSAEHEQRLLDDLRWLGLEWDEGPDRGGSNGPYHQSRRGDSYAQAYERLEADDLAYPCFCTAEELQRARAAMRAAGKPPRYPGTCAQLTAAERRARAAEGRAASLRFRVTRGRRVTFEDLVRGEQAFDTDTIGDFVIRRGDASPAFFFANALDDAHMGVTHVLRGEDHLANTPRQLLLLEALELAAPVYGHLTLVLSPEGKPLSKRAGAMGLAELHDQGFLPAAIRNYLARLGHHYDDDSLLSFDALVKGFHPERLGRASAHFDPVQLDHWQKLAVAGLDTRAFTEWMGTAARAMVPAANLAEFVEAVRPNSSFPGDAVHWALVLFREIPEYSAAAKTAIGDAGPEFFARAATAVSGRPDEIIAAIKQATGAKGKSLFMPLRAALTGDTRGPELASIMTLLGPDKTAERLRQHGRDA